MKGFADLTPYFLGSRTRTKELPAPHPCDDCFKGRPQVTWVITIATFLGTIVASVLVSLLYSDRRRIRGLLRKTPQRRLEMRISTRVRLELASLDEPSLREITLTRNVSVHGACAFTENRWVPNNTVQVRFLNADVRTRARIAYCKPFCSAFIVGLRFSTPIRSRSAHKAYG